MKIFRFDAEVSAPGDGLGSRFRIGRLTAEGANGQVQVVHLGAGAVIARQRADRRRLFAVVTGAGWVSGGDGQRRLIQAGQAAVWERGEEHDAGCDDGLMAVVLDGTFEMTAFAVTRNIVVDDYSSEWTDWFEQLRAHVWPAVDGLALRIDHVGSTAVPGLAAKPIIDMDIVVADEARLRPVMDALSALGYLWEGDGGVPGRQAFDTSSQVGLPAHHLYLVVEHNKAHLDHILLRDLLRADPEARRQYGELKRTNVRLAQGDIDVYTAAKARFVAELLTRARAERGLEPATYWTPELPATNRG